MMIIRTSKSLPTQLLKNVVKFFDVLLLFFLEVLHSQQILCVKLLVVLI